MEKNINNNIKNNININNNINNKTNYRIIFHIDMNCFFASCHIAINDKLRNKPIVVAHNDEQKKSIILTASYEARKYGIYTTMLVRDAIKLCPQVIVVEPDYELYERFSKLFFEYMFSITPFVEAMSIDEGFLDVTEICKTVDAIKLATTIQNRLYNEFKLPCSIGIAPNKFLAKMGSDIKKPMGITVVRKRELDKVIWPLDIKNMFGVGKKTEPKLREIGINKIGDIINFKDKELLERTVGPAFTKYLIDRANGIDDSPVTVVKEDDFSSVSNEHTFSYNVNSIETIKMMIKILGNSVGERLEKHNFFAYTIGIKIKYNDFTVVQRSRGLNKPINDDYAIYRICSDLFDEFNDTNKTVRLIGVFATRLTKSEKAEKEERLTLFDDMSKFEKAEQDKKVNKLLDNINRNLGKDIIKVGINKN
ncbi:MAG: DNA polymerase IV [Bacilli bacterium]|nr:DNA polymerase IV [Bacilli bacterium]